MIVDLVSVYRCLHVCLFVCLLACYLVSWLCEYVCCVYVGLFALGTARMDGMIVKSIDAGLFISFVALFIGCVFLFVLFVFVFSCCFWIGG